jgi:hypothetical protein
MIEFSLNGRMMDVSTEHQLSAALAVADAELVFDLSVAVPDGSAMFMLRNASDAWLMHLREPGDAGARSSGDTTRQGDISYTLSNGQVDQYPSSWCLDVEQCYKAVAYFCVNQGAAPDWVTWVEGG